MSLTLSGGNLVVTTPVVILLAILGIYVVYKKLMGK